MSWETLFTLTNYWAFFGWFVLIFLPRNPKLLALLLYAGVGLLCLVYTGMLGAILTGVWDAEGPKHATDFSTLAGVMAFFATKGGAVVGWTHYLAFDLFTGLWIAHDADNKGFRRVWQFPVLAMTLLIGPIGLLLWLVVREPAARRRAKQA